MAEPRERRHHETIKTSAPFSASQGLPTINDPRMKLYEQREREFLDFMNSCPQATELTSDETGDRPLSGLQCLLALTEILDKAAQLRLANHDLEQRIEVLQRFKEITEIQSDLHRATLDVNANGLIRGRKFKSTDDVDFGRLKRTLSAESIDTLHTPTIKLEHSDKLEHRATHGKGSKFSERWGKVKDKLAPKEGLHITPHISKPFRRSRNADLAGSMRRSLSAAADTPSPSQSSVTVQFTQREINISQPQTADGDFGGVWLGDDNGDGGALDHDLMEYGGVWLGPSTIVHPHHEAKLNPEGNNSDYSVSLPSKEALERKTSEPAVTSQLAAKLECEVKPGLNAAITRIRSTSNDESQDWLAKNKNKDNQSPTFLRKKSSKLLAHAAQLLPGSEQKRVRKVEQGNQLPKEFRKKIEEWHTKKDGTPTQETSEVASAAKSGKGGKLKTQRFKSKKRGGLLKQRSKSAERMDGSSPEKQHRDDFDEKLREWSVKQGYHPSYYSDIRDSQGSADSVGEVSMQGEGHNGRVGHQNYVMNLSEGISNNSLTLNTRISSCTDSTSSLSPAATVNSFHSAENLKTLYEISQSADVVFHRETPRDVKSPHKLSWSEEAINKSLCSNLLVSSAPRSASVASSNIDLYARASDQSLEKHLSLYHMTSESSLNQETAEDLQSAHTQDRPSYLHIETRPLSGDHAEVVTKEISKEDELSQTSDISPGLALGIITHDLTQLQLDNQEDVRVTNEISSKPELADHDSRSNTGNELSDKLEPSDNHIANEVCNNSKLSDNDTVSNAGNEVYDKSEHSDSHASPSTGNEVYEMSKPSGSHMASSTGNEVHKKSEPSGNLTGSHIGSKSLDDIKDPVSSVSKHANSDSARDNPASSSITSTSVHAGNTDVVTTPSEMHQTRDTELKKSCVSLPSPSTEDASCVAEGHATSGKGAEPSLSSAAEAQKECFVPDNSKTEEASTAMATMIKDTPPDKQGYDINSNITGNSENKQSMAGTDSSPTSNSIHHLGTDVPLKMRLKSLAMEYEKEDCKRNSSTTPHYIRSNSSAHKRTRSYDILSQSGFHRQLYSSDKTNLHVAASDDPEPRAFRSSSVSNSADKPASTKLQHDGVVNISGLNHIGRPQRSNVHRLKSADELIYEQSPHSNRKHYNRNATVSNIKIPMFDVRNRRELYEKPKEGTVKKAMSMFLDGGTFNAQFGTDFAKSATSRTPPT